MKKILSVVLILTVLFWSCTKSGSSPGNNSATGGGAVTIGALDANYPGEFIFRDTTYEGYTTNFYFSYANLDSVEYVSINSEDEAIGDTTTYNTIVFDNVPAAASGSFPLSPNIGSVVVQGTDSVGAAINLHYYLGNQGPVPYVCVNGSFTKTGALSFSFTGSFINQNTGVAYKISGKGTY